VRRMVLASLVGSSGVALVIAALPALAKQDSAGSAGSPEAMAVAAADRATTSGMAGLAKGPGETFVRVNVTTGDGGLRYVSYERTYQGVPIVGGDAVVVTDARGNILSTASAMAHPLAMPATTGAIAPHAAGARQVILAGDSARLAWETVVQSAPGQAPSRMHVFTDARTGQVLDSYDEVRDDTANTFYDGKVTINVTPGKLVDPTRAGLSCGPLSNRRPFTNVGTTWGNGSGTDLKTACTEAFFTVEKETDMLKTWLGRNGLDGKGHEFPLFVGLNQVNAFWDGQSGNFGHSSDNRRQATSIDVVAHEMGHAIFQFTPGGSGGGNETGGINEGTGDIFGALTEAFANNPKDKPDFTVGEAVNLVGNGPIRFMFNPSRIAGHPNCFSNAIPRTEVHAGAGPLNHWFYLVAEGTNPTDGNPVSPTCNNSKVTGITIRNAGRIYMGALLRKTSGWKYANVRVASLQAAKQLFPNSCTEFNTVKAAWNAVSVPAQPGEPTCG
jgi:Zn-dependent metalloprotease